MLVTPMIIMTKGCTGNQQLILGI